MQESNILYEHIIETDGVFFIKDTSTKVIEIINEHLAYGWSPEEIHFQHPYLSLGQIYSALAYYWDNKDKIDEEIISRQNIIQKIKEERRSPLIEKLKVKKIS